MEAPMKRSPPPPPQQQSSSPMSTGTTTPITTTTTQPSASSKTTVAQEAMILEKFTSLLGTTNSHRTKELSALLSKTVKDDQVVLMVPSLDLQFTAEGSNSSSGSGSNVHSHEKFKDILPQLGTHNSIGTSESLPNRLGAIPNDDQEPPPPTTTRPNMAASVLNRNATASSPLQPPNHHHHHHHSDTALRSQHSNTTWNTDTVDSSLPTVTPQDIGKQTSWTKSTLPYTYSAVGTNITESFTTLFNARLRAWTLILLRHSLSTGSTDSRTKLLGLLQVQIGTTAVHDLAYRTLPLPDAAKNAKPMDSDIILPLLFEVTLNLSIQEKTEKVTLRAPGTVSGILDVEHSPSLLKKVNIQLDMGVFLKSMIDQARMIVLKAVSSATETQLPSASVASSTKMSSTATTKDAFMWNNKEIKAPSTVATPGRSDGPKRPTTAELERMQKARKSALRLNSVLHGKPLKSSVSSILLGSGSSAGSTSGMQNDSTSGMRKVTSIRWDHTVQDSKLTLTPNTSISPGTNKKKHKLESFKSFGRPHGGDFGSGPRNATFGEYGRPAFAGAWGRDGRLVAHPAPSKNSGVDSMGNLVGGSADLNATFDHVVQPSSGKKRALGTHYMTQGGIMDTTAAIGAYRSSAASAGAALLGRLSNPHPASSASSSTSLGSSAALPTRISETTLHRTATALENSLMKKWS